MEENSHFNVLYELLHDAPSPRGGGGGASPWKASDHARHRNKRCSLIYRYMCKKVWHVTRSGAVAYCNILITFFKTLPCYYFMRRTIGKKKSTLHYYQARLFPCDCNYPITACEVFMPRARPLPSVPNINLNCIITHC